MIQNMKSNTELIKLVSKIENLLIILRSIPINEYTFEHQKSLLEIYNFIKDYNSISPIIIDNQNSIHIRKTLMNTFSDIIRFYEANNKQFEDVDIYELCLKQYFVEEKIYNAQFKVISDLNLEKYNNSKQVDSAFFGGDKQEYENLQKKDKTISEELCTERIKLENLSINYLKKKQEIQKYCLNIFDLINELCTVYKTLLYKYSDDRSIVYFTPKISEEIYNYSKEVFDCSNSTEFQNFINRNNNIEVKYLKNCKTKACHFIHIISNHMEANLDQQAWKESIFIELNIELEFYSKKYFKIPDNIGSLLNQQLVCFCEEHNLKGSQLDS